jgi:DNA (cytosine-5)-methyltransferase 1
LNLRIGGGDVDNTQNIISFCTGYGGIELGLRRAGVDVRTVCNVEIEAFVQANLVAKIEEGRMDNAPIYSDLKTFPARIFRGKICGIIGGYPCQPFSSAGKRKGEKDPRHLWPYIREHVRAIRPVWCFFENVRGHTTMGLWRVLSDLEEDGYRTEWGLFSAEETGAPHQRIRCFILAHTASREPRQSQARNGGQDIGGGSEDTRWPARPGEEQYEWEEPRVTEAQSELGGAVDGSACGVDATANRVDRLRLLGNGVVPQTAEIAWKTLWEKLSEQS